MVGSASHYSIWKAEALCHELKASLELSLVHCKQRKLSEKQKINLSKYKKLRHRRIQMQFQNNKKF